MKTTKELIIADITAKVKAKLASQKVELSLIEDFRKLLSTATADFKEFDKAFLKFHDFKKLTINFGEKYVGHEQKLEALYSQLSKASKELGIDFNSTKEGKEAIGLAGSGDPKRIKGFIDKIKSI